jgi:hypothetical protein
MLERFCLLLESQIVPGESWNHARVSNCLPNGFHLLVELGMGVKGASKNCPCGKVVEAKG